MRMYFQVIFFAVLLPMVMEESDMSFFYNMDRDSKTGFDCFYARMIDEINRVEKTPLRIDHSAMYCLRPISNDSTNGSLKLPEGNVKNVVTFESLRSQGISSELLLQWSISIDIIEQYAIYLIRKDPKFDHHVFYNCSSSWFGSRCQYTFGSNFLIESFGDFVNSSFKSRNEFSWKIIINTCYPHLSECHRGPTPMCLDWREICDGKIDCIGDSFGLDEQYCEELEMNECQEDEYRCHNGAQCIPIDFFRDGWTSIDCLDGTDEDEKFQENTWDKPIPLECIDLVTFSCEERTCRYPRSFSCGDGKCKDQFPLLGRVELNISSCRGTGRDSYYSRAIYLSARELSSDCYKLLFCKLRFYNFLVDDSYNEQDCLSDKWISSNNCSMEYLPFPADPLFSDYFQLLYLSKNLVNNVDGDAAPVYVCTDPRICLHLSNTTFQRQGLDCRPFEQLFLEDIIEHIYHLHGDLREDAQSCSLKGNINKYPSNSSLFYCEQSYKYISKHRLIDGTKDCHNNEDELYADSCSLNDSQRYPCQSENKCLSPSGIGPARPDCKDEEDKMIDDLILFVFQRLCNLFYDFPKENNEKDEANCEWWPCLNPYSRCDSYFQCANGIDELDCPDFDCGTNEYGCTIDEFNDYQCVSRAHLYTELINCTAHVGNRRIKQKVFYSKNLTIDNNKYLSWNKKTCLTEHDICSDQSIDENPLVCSMLKPQKFDVHGVLLYNMDHNEQLCTLVTKYFKMDRPRPFSTWNLGYIPSATNIASSSSSQPHIKIKTMKTVFMNNSVELIEFCNRGIVIFEGQSYEKNCLCPPNYFGDRCEWQSERVSLTVQILTMGSIDKQFSIYDLFIYLINDQYGTIEYYEEINYIPSIDCETKFNRYLLYPTRPKNKNHSYSIHINMFDKITLTYYGSWYLSIHFPFLPVNRLATQIRIPFQKSEPSLNCSLECGIHGTCFDYINLPKSFCYCDKGYSGHYCSLIDECSCSSDSICLNSSICLCPLDKFGSKCYLQHTSCLNKNNPCQNNGQCVPINNHIRNKDFVCLCTEGYMGSYCEHKPNQIDITFKTDIIPSLVFAHFITAFDNQMHQRITTFQKVPFDQDWTSLFIRQSFHILFIEYFDNLYLTVLREQFIPLEHISTDVNIDNMCINITKLLNSTILDYNYIRRIKHYQLPCLENPKLKCFYDNQHMCICDQARYSNCLNFKFNMSYNCRGSNPCLNNGTCFQDNPTCPSKSACMCKECYYGSRCEMTTTGFSLSLDAIFGYQIKPNVSFFKQSKAVKVTAALTIVMLVLGFLSGLLSILTFRTKSSVAIGCGIYLLSTSIVSLLTISMFTIKYWQLVLFQINAISNRSFIKFNCLITDMLLKVLLSSGDWLNACIAIERAMTAIQGITFNKVKSKYIAKRMTPIVFLLTIVSYVHDPISRQLFDHTDENRIWCIAKYSSELKAYDRFINLFHFLTPFIINFLSALIIIVQVYKIRLKIQTKLTRRTLLFAEIKRHKHLLISSSIIILLAIPRLIISLLSRCMKSARDPWLFLSGYYISFVPPLLIFIIYVLPSEKYRDEFLAIIRKRR